MAVQKGSKRGEYHNPQATVGEVLDILEKRAPTPDKAMTPEELLTQMKIRGNLGKLPGKNTLTTLLRSMYEQGRYDHFPFVLECGVERTDEGSSALVSLEQWEAMYPDTQRNKSLRFYLRNLLTPTEWKIFEDMVQVYPYIDEEQAKKYLKILSRMSRRPVPANKELRYAFRRSGTLNFSLIERLDQAIEGNRMVTITYGEYQLSKETSKPVLRQRAKNGVFQFCPYALIWSNGYYYLTGQHHHWGLSNLRVDRILEVNLEKEMFERPEGFEPGLYRDMSPVMYAGKIQYIKLACEDSLLNVAVDFFGSAARYTPQPDGTFLLELRAVPAGVMLFLKQYLSAIKILAPDSLRKKLRGELLRQIERLEE